MPGMAEVAKRMRKAEKAVLNLNPEGRLQLDPEGRLWIAHPRPLAEGQLRPDYENVAPIEGLLPELWQIQRPEGSFALGLRYPGPEQLCVLSGEVFTSNTPVGLYFEGRPVRADLAKTEAPILTALYALLLSLERIIEAGRNSGKTPEEVRSEYLDSLIHFICHDLERRLREEFKLPKHGKKKSAKGA